MKRFACIVMVFITIGLLFSCGQERKKLQNDFDTKAIELIKEFYNKYVFGKFDNEQERILNNYCTKKLINNYLIEDDYDDGPYYFLNAFVNGSQDYGFECRVTDVEALGDGKYKVHFIDYGKGFLVIKVVMDDGVLKLDELSDGGWEEKPI